MNSDHAVAVLIVAPEGVPLVRDPKKPAPRYWKLPGGRSEGDESPEECAIREILEETGIKADIDDLTVFEQLDKGSHILTFFKLKLPSLAGLKSIGNEQEEIKIFPKDAVSKLPDLFPNHRAIIVKGL